MTRNQIRITLLSGFALVAALIASRPVAPQDAKEPYPNMAPIEQYLMDRDAEIALASGAAPDAISHDASVIVLTRHGYETAVQGENGWVCMVERGWMAMFDNPEFWNPKVRAADCLNPPAARFITLERSWYFTCSLGLSAYGNDKSLLFARLRSVVGLQVRSDFSGRVFGNLCAVGFVHFVHLGFPSCSGQWGLHGDVAKAVARAAIDLDVLAAITDGEIESGHRIRRNLIDRVW